MSDYYDILIVGAGPAGMGLAHRATQIMPDYSIGIIEKGRPALKRRCIAQEGMLCPETSCGPCNIMTGVGGAGTRSDGKLLLCPEIGGDLQQYFGGDKKKAYELIDRLDEEIWTKYDPEVETSFVGGTKEEMYELRRKARVLGMDFLVSKQKHIGSDNLPTLIQSFMEDLKGRDVDFRTQTTVDDILFEEKEGGYKKAVGVKLENGEEIRAKYVALCVGRSGHDWIINLADKNGISYLHRPIDIGVRVEVLKDVMDPITDISYDFKLHITAKPSGNKVRTFCTNPGGEVAKEDYPGEKIVSVNGHSKKGKKTENTNFALLTTISFTKPLANSHEYGRHVGETGYTLGGGKVLLQRLGDLRNFRRSKQKDIDKNLVQPTLSRDNYCPGDLDLLLGGKITRNLLSGFEQLAKIIPGIDNDETLLYAPEIKKYSARFTIDENFMTNIQNLFVAGDGAGLSRDIVNSNATGWLAAMGISRLEKDKK